MPQKNHKVFGNTLGSKRHSFEHTRKRLAQQTGNPRFLQIHFHTLRHLRATLWYHSGVDLRTLQHRLGHKDVTVTFKYVHLSETMFPDAPDEYYTRVTSTIKEGESLVQQGFEFVGSDQSSCLWRKRKRYEDIIKERELAIKTENSSTSLFNSHVKLMQR